MSNYISELVHHLKYREYENKVNSKLSPSVKLKETERVKRCIATKKMHSSVNKAEYNLVVFGIPFFHLGCQLAELSVLHFSHDLISIVERAETDEEREQL